MAPLDGEGRVSAQIVLLLLTLFCGMLQQEIAGAQRIEKEIRAATNLTLYPGLYAEPKPEGFDYYSGELPSRSDPQLKWWFHHWQIPWACQTPDVLMPRAAEKYCQRKRAEEKQSLLRAEAHRLMCEARFDEETHRMPKKKRAALRVIYLGSHTTEEASRHYGIKFDCLNVAWYRLRQRLPEL